MAGTESGKVQLWGGRFSEKVDPLMEAFNDSLHFDRRLWKADITGSKAYATALSRTGIISDEEAQKLRNGLDLVGQEWASNSFVVKPGDEDIHTANERRLGELIGSEVAGKLHTGRSRNDQVATDVRLWLRDEIAEISKLFADLVSIAATRAESEIDLLMPGYTHLQRAQPVRWSHWLLSHCFAWQRDAQRVSDLVQRVNVSPLGSGALAGNPFGVNRAALAEELGFGRASDNSLDSVGDRDFIAEFLFAASMTMLHLSKWAEDLIVYCTAEFGFVSLSDAYSTGSSLMPQKKNPDSLELLRGKSGRVFGDLSGLMMTLKGLPSTYNKDLQEDKEPLFDAVDTLKGCLRISQGVLATLRTHGDRMRRALTVDMLATDLADYLVRKGVHFRQTHHIAGRAVKMAEAKGCQLSEISLAEYKTLHPSFDDDMMLIWDFERSVEMRISAGGTSRPSVLAQIETLRAWAGQQS
eukprot:TRINITY_DN6867_c0_g1_i1.p1 TRINITY_DN6867_c0_g1~~TRINITY_DN6867_c0_g1_i1.p1  ORF type:complete len:468 (-),score=176.03 TRINITY_DN6867_c0_g1_i1:219-1622(-)